MTLSGRRVLIEDPPIARFLFQSTIAARGWLILRVWVGAQFPQAVGTSSMTGLDGPLRQWHPRLLDQRTEIDQGLEQIFRGYWRIAHITS
jgi:hypothetical protein